MITITTPGTFVNFPWTTGTLVVGTASGSIYRISVGEVHTILLPSSSVSGAGRSMIGRDVSDMTSVGGLFDRRSGSIRLPVVGNSLRVGRLTTSRVVSVTWESDAEKQAQEWESALRKNRAVRVV